MASKFAAPGSVQRHGVTQRAFAVWADPPNDAHHVLDDIDTGERAPQASQAGQNG